MSWADWMAWWIGKTCWQAGNPGDNRCRQSWQLGKQTISSSGGCCFARSPKMSAFVSHVWLTGLGRGGECCEAELLGRWCCFRLPHWGTQIFHVFKWKFKLSRDQNMTFIKSFINSAWSESSFHPLAADNVRNLTLLVELEGVKKTSLLV